MKKLFFFLLSFCIYCFAFSQQNGLILAGNLNGEVIDLISNQPIENVKVFIYQRDVDYGPNGEPILNPVENSILISELRTDKLGKFQIELSLRKETDYFNLRIESENKETLYKNIVTISNGENVEIILQMTPLNPNAIQQDEIEKVLKDEIFKKDYDKMMDSEKQSEELKKKSNQILEESFHQSSSSSSSCTYSSIPINVYVSNLYNGYNGSSTGSGYTGYIGFDEYIAGVVQGEISAFTSNIETKKAQAVAARTFSMSRHLSGLAVNIGQAYNDNPNSSSVNSSNLTSQQIILYNGNVIDAKYSARCNGDYTQNANEGTWSPNTNCNRSGSIVPYLKSVTCSGHVNCQNTGESKCCNVIISTSNVSGYIYGHGVGMCQRGIIQRGPEGWDYVDMINHYYTGVCIANTSINTTPPICDNDNPCSPKPLSINTSGSCINTNCSTVNATPPSPDIPFYGSSTCATPYQAGRYDDDVWFSITPSTTAPITIKVTPTSNISNFDVTVGLYQGSCSNPTQVGCGTSGGKGVAESLVFTPTANTTYLIRVFSYDIGSTYSGNFDICVTTPATSPTLAVSPASLTLGASSGSNGSISVSSNVSWTASDNASWLSISPTSGSNNGTITVTATSANTSTSSRNGTVTITGSGITRTVSVTQDGATPTPTLTVSPSSLTLGATSGSNGQINVSSNLSWTASDDASWLSVSPTSGSNNGTITVTATSANTGTSSRSGTVTITGSGITRTVSVTQDANTTCDPTPSATTANFTSSGGSGSFNINVGAGCYWNIYNSCSTMLTNIAPTDGYGPATVTYNVLSNNNSTSRNCQITIQQNLKSHKVTQEGNCTVPTSPTSATATQTTITSGQSTTLEVNGGALNSAPNWVWYTGNCGGSQIGTGATLSVSPSSTTTYYVQASACGTTTTCRSVTINVSSGCYAPSAPASCTTSIGNPANGLQHITNLSCDSVSGADGYSFEFTWDGITWNINWAQTPDHINTVNNGDSPNEPIYYRVRAFKCTPQQYSNYTYASPQPIYTACDDPVAPSINGISSNSFNVTLNTETPIANPSYTTYSIYCVSTNQYVQTNGTLGGQEVFQTKNQWGTKAVTGLMNNREYIFYAKARNNNGDVRYNPSNTVSYIISGINDVPASDKIKIKPNPTTGKFEISEIETLGNECKVEIIDNLGSLIYISVYKNFGNKISLDLSPYTEGLYLIKLSNNEVSYQKKVIKK